MLICVSSVIGRCASCRLREVDPGATEQRDELAALHSITSSARTSSDGGTSRPRALAILWLITSSYFTLMIQRSKRHHC
jgi:hypothetical protein